MDKSTQEKNGVIWVAFGDLYLSMAILSMKSLKNHNSLPCTVVTNKLVDINQIDFWDPINDKLIYLDIASSENRDVKTAIYNYASYERTLYLDCDTIIREDITMIFKYLDYFDFCIRPYIRKRTGYLGNLDILNQGAKVKDYPHFNGGVFAFRRNQANKNFFEKWGSVYNFKNIPPDQFSLVEALFESDVRILPLGIEYNYHPGIRFMFKPEDVKIVHYIDRFFPEITYEILSISKLVEEIDFNVVQYQLNIKRYMYMKKHRLYYLLYRILLMIKRNRVFS